MAADSSARSELPVACTLSAAEGGQRMEDWRGLRARAGIARETAPGRVSLRFRDAPGIHPALQKLVEAERGCCAFLDWQLVRDDKGWRVEISGSEEGVRSLPVTFTEG